MPLDTRHAFIGDYYFLSNFYPVEIEYDGLIYPSVEHAYQAAKSDEINYKIIFTTSQSEYISTITAKEAKKFGQKVKLINKWEYKKVDIMRQLLIIKFNNNILASKLIDTGDLELVEYNYWKDYYWGICNGEGNNILGKLLMQVRSELNNQRIINERI